MGSSSKPSPESIRRLRLTTIATAGFFPSCCGRYPPPKKKAHPRIKENTTHPSKQDHATRHQTGGLAPVDRAPGPDPCGGLGGYYNFLDAIHDPKHEEHEDLLEWIGGNFDPHAFSVEDVNRRLAPKRSRRASSP